MAYVGPSGSLINEIPVNNEANEQIGWGAFCFPALTLTTMLVQIYCGVMTPWKDGAKDDALNTSWGYMVFFPALMYLGNYYCLGPTFLDWASREGLHVNVFQDRYFRLTGLSLWAGVIYCLIF